MNDSSLEKQIIDERREILQLLYRTGQRRKLWTIYIVRGVGYGAGAVLFWGAVILIYVSYKY